MVDGIRFASKKEASRYGDLKLMEKAGLIDQLELQPKYPLHVNGHKICTYIADFRYMDVETGTRIVEDAKGFKTPAYKLKKKLMKVIHEIEVFET